MSRVTFQRQTVIRAPLEDVFEFFSEPRNLAKITPPSLGFAIVSCPDRRLEAGDRIVYTIRILGIRIRWVTRITEWVDGKRFADLQEKGPYRYWLHTHEFAPTPEGVAMIDTVTYELPLGRVGQLFGGGFVRRQVAAIFDYREATIAATFGVSTNAGAA